jgi:hypothetical protein
MAFNAEQLSYGGRAAIEFYLKNDPIDQINTEHPLLKALVAKKQEWAGGLQNVVEQLRYSNDSNFQAYFGDSQVTYNRKRTLQQAKYAWGSFHDGFGLNEDELTQNGITMTDDRSAVPTDAEKVQLTNLIKENMETLKLGFNENFDLMLHRDGTQDALEIPGLDHLVSLTPSSGVIGGLAASNTWWQNYANTSVTTTSGAVVEAWEDGWRECIRFGGSPPDLILCGSDMYDAYRIDAKETINRRLDVKGRGGTDMDASVSGIYFKGVEVVWDPVMDTLDDLDSPAKDWAKRVYFLNTKFLKLRPIKGHWLIPRRPPRVYDRYVHYWGLTAKAALTTSKRNAHAVLALS